MSPEERTHRTASEPPPELDAAPASEAERALDTERSNPTTLEVLTGGDTADAPARYTSAAQGRSLGVLAPFLAMDRAKVTHGRCRYCRELSRILHATVSGSLEVRRIEICPACDDTYDIPASGAMELQLADGRLRVTGSWDGHCTAILMLAPYPRWRDVKDFGPAEPLSWKLPDGVTVPTKLMAYVVTQSTYFFASRRWFPAHSTVGNAHGAHR